MLLSARGVDAGPDHPLRRAEHAVAPTAGGAEPFIDADDIAAVAAAAPTGAAAPGAYDLSGPAALTLGEAAEVLGDRTGRPVRHVDLPVEQWVRGAQGNGLPAEYAAMLGAPFALIRSGRDAHLSDGVQAALGRPATRFEDWAGEVAAG